MKNKKVLIILIIAVIVNIAVISNAATYSFNFNANPKQTNANKNDTITIELAISDIDSSTEGINAIQGNISYDEEVFENVELVAIQDNWSVSFNKLDNSELKGNFVLSNMNSVKESQIIAKLTATVKENASKSAGQICFNNVFSSYGTTETKKVNKEVNIKVNNSSEEINNVQKNNDNTTVKKSKASSNKTTNLPQTGINNIIIFFIFICIIFSIIICIKYKKIDK